MRAAGHEDAVPGEDGDLLDLRVVEQGGQRPQQRGAHPRPGAQRAHLQVAVEDVRDPHEKPATAPLVDEGLDTRRQRRLESSRRRRPRGEALGLDRRGEALHGVGEPVDGRGHGGERIDGGDTRR